MGVKEELEALRSQGVTKKNANKLKNASGLSTPEAEENAIKTEQERNRVGNYKKDAERNLKSYNEAKVAVEKSSDTPTKVTTQKAETTSAKIEEVAAVNDVPTLDE